MAKGLKSVRNRRDDALSRIDWARLETLLAEHYRREGYDVEHVGTGGTGRRFDGGIDLKLRDGSAYVLVQAKHWNAYQVTHNSVHELLGLMVNEGATGAILVTSGEFTQAAIDAASRQGHVQLIDGGGLREMLGPIEDEPEKRFRMLPGSIASKSRAARRPGTPKRIESRIWLLVAAVGVIAFVLLARELLHRASGFAESSQVSRAAQSATPTIPSGASSTVETPAEAAPGCEVIDHFSNTVLCEQPPSGAVVHRAAKPTEEEIRESQRRADEAMKIIEATTPEL